MLTALLTTNRLTETAGYVGAREPTNGIIYFLLKCMMTREWAVVRVCKDCHAKIHSILNNERLRNYQSDDPKSDYQKDLKAVEDLHALIHLKKVVNRLRPGWLEE